MKRISIWGLVLLLTISLVGCSGGTTTTTPTVTSTKASVNYPTGDISFLIPNAAGGGNDLTTRVLIPALQKDLGKNVVPLNKGESKGAIAASGLANSKPDGQTLYFNSQSLILLPFSGVTTVNLEDFQPVAQVAEDTGVIYVKADSPYTTIQQFIAAAKEKTLKVGSNGQGALWHLAEIQLQDVAGVKFQIIPYTTGGAQMLTSLAAGETDMTIVNPSEAKAMVDAGKVKPIATMSQDRLEVFSNVPTLKEAGINLVFPVWRGVFTRKGTSEEVLNRLDQAFASAVKSQQFVDYCKTSSLPIKYRDHKEFTEFYNDQIKIYTKLMKTINTK